VTAGVKERACHTCFNGDVHVKERGDSRAEVRAGDGQYQARRRNAEARCESNCPTRSHTGHMMIA